MCAHQHPSDDDRQPPRGLADALSRWDTEQGWMRSTPGHEADGTEHVPSPESTPGQFFPPADQSRPRRRRRSTAGTRSCRATPERRGPPIRGLRPPSPSRSCGSHPATRSIAGYGPREPTLPERWPSEASALRRSPSQDPASALGASPASELRELRGPRARADSGRRGARPADEAQRPADTRRSAEDPSEARPGSTVSEPERDGETGAVGSRAEAGRAELPER